MQRPAPRPTELSKPFWDACRDRRLLVQRCGWCGAYVFLPRAFCPECRSTELSWVESSGEGVIVTYTTVWRPQTPAFEVPYVVAVVRLAEGYEMMTNLVDCEVDAVTTDLPVRVRFVDIDDDVTLPCFELAS